ncbi:unnamed protein product [Peniophora sp. CBMAI 1063]|nr:unnamed protein product [Peniophora sp. CBMAI 1063]
MPTSDLPPPASPPPGADMLSLLQDGAAPAADPPPPYPAPSRRARRLRRLAHASGGEQEHNDDWPVSPSEDNEGEPDERAPLLGHRPPGGLRPRALSQSSASPSAISGAPSLVQALRLDLDSDVEDDEDDEEGHTERGELSVEESDSPTSPTTRPRRSFWGRVKLYFKPLVRRAYWAAVFHLLVLNFPYALLAAVYLFVFTLVGTTLLVALPLGAVVCFFDLLGARALARGEVLLQTTYHGPLGYELVAPLPPIFTRTRAPTTAELEDGTSGPQRERSFYRNTYAMFTDPTSYHALFYFLVIKPSMTLLLSLFLVLVVPLSIALVLPAPAALRLTRRLGIWQANIAVEGLYMGGTG